MTKTCFYIPFNLKQPMFNFNINSKDAVLQNLLLKDEGAELKKH